MPAGKQPYIISLSSIPSRFTALGPVLAALQNQTVPPDRVILYVPRRYRRFPDYDGTLPAVPRGVEIRQPEQDFGPASKILHAVREFQDTERCDILFADDDLLYEPEWAERLLEARKHHPDAVICAHGLELEDLGFQPGAGRLQPRASRLPRWRDFGYLRRKTAQQAYLRRLKLERHEKPPKTLYARSGYTDIFEGFAGVLVQPRFFGPEVFDIPNVLWTVDDVWLSGMVTKQGVPIWLESDATRYRYTPARHADALNASVIEGADRDNANRLCVQYMQQQHNVWN